MTIDDALITRIVEGVLAELSTSTAGVRIGGNGSTATPADTGRVAGVGAQSSKRSPQQTVPSVFAGGSQSLDASHPTAMAHSSPVRSNSRHIAEPVITAEVLEKSLNGSRKVTFGKKAVLTPSAREFLKKRNIEWTRGGTSNSKPPAVAATWKAFIVQATPALESAAAEVSRKVAGFVRDLSGSTKEATELAVGAVCKAEVAGTLIVTREPAAAACRANRNGRIRAAVVRDVVDVERVRRELGANVVCLDPAERSHFELRNLLRAIVTGPAPKLPEGWSD